MALKFKSSEEKRLALGLEAVEQNQVVELEANIDASSETSYDAIKRFIFKLAKIHTDVLLRSRTEKNKIYLYFFQPVLMGQSCP